jgi:hypothetical protein
MAAHMMLARPEALMLPLLADGFGWQAAPRDASLG